MYICIYIYVCMYVCMYVLKYIHAQWAQVTKSSTKEVSLFLYFCTSKASKLSTYMRSGYKRRRAQRRKP